MRRQLLVALVALTGMIALFAQPAYAVDFIPDCQTADGTSCSLVEEDKLNYEDGAPGVWGIIQLVMIIMAGVAVVVIVIGGIKYTVSQGDSSAITGAKNTILYAVVGLVVAILATAIIGFVNSYFA